MLFLFDFLLLLVYVVFTPSRLKFLVFINELCSDFGLGAILVRIGELSAVYSSWIFDIETLHDSNFDCLFYKTFLNVEL